MSAAHGDTDGTSAHRDDRTTVVVITRNRRSELLRTLGLLSALPERPPIVVTDNASSDGTAAAVAQSFPEALLLCTGRNLDAVGRNVAVARVRTPYVAFCDDETWWEAGALRRRPITSPATPGSVRSPPASWSNRPASRTPSSPS